MKLFSAQIWRKKKPPQLLKPKHRMEDAAVLYIYSLNFVVLRFQVEAAAASFHNL